MFEHDLFGEIDRVLGQYRRMQQGFHTARAGLTAATQGGRLPSGPAPGTDARLISAGRAYERAASRLARARARLWSNDLGVARDWQRP